MYSVLAFFPAVFFFALFICAVVFAAVYYSGRKQILRKNERLLHFLNYLRREGRISDQEWNAAFTEQAPGPVKPQDVQLQTEVRRQPDRPVTAPDQIPAAPQEPHAVMQSLQLSAAQQQSKSFSALNVVLIIGVIFVILSGLIFATTSWLYLSNILRTVIICSLSLVFFGTSFLAEKVFRIPKTAVAFYTLGSIFLPITILTLGFFRLLGSWFSISGGGQYLLYMTASILLCIAAYFGALKYRNGYFTAGFLFCITASVLFFTRSLYLPYDVFILVMFVFCAAVTFVSDFLDRKSAIRSKYGHIVSHLKLFAILNVTVIGSVGLITNGTGLLSGISGILISGLFLKGMFRKGDTYWGVFPFAVFVIAGFMKCNLNGDFNNYIMLAALSSAVIILCGVMNVFPAKMKKWLGVAGGIWAGSVFVWQFSSFFIDDIRWTLLHLLAVAVLLCNIVLAAVIHKSKIFMSAMPFVAVTLIAGICSYLSFDAFPPGLFMTILSAATFGIVFFLDRRSISISPRTVTSDLVFTVWCLAGGFVDIYTDGLTSAAVSSHAASYTIGSLLSFLILIGISAGLAFEQKRSGAGWVFGFGLPHFVMLLVLPFQIYFEGQADVMLLMLALYGIIASAAVICLLLQSRYNRLHRMKIPFLSALVLYGSFVPFFQWAGGSSNLYPLYLWILTAYFVISLAVHAVNAKDTAKRTGTAALYYAAGTGLFLSVLASAKCLMPSAHVFYVYLIPAALAAVLFAAFVLMKYAFKIKRDEYKFFYHVTNAGLHLFSILTVLLFAADSSIAAAYASAVFVLPVLCLTGLYMEKGTASAWIAVSLLYAAFTLLLYKLAVPADSVLYIAGFTGAFAVIAAAGRYLHSRVFSSTVLTDGKKRVSIDWFTILDVTGASVLLVSGWEWGRFAGIILFIMYAVLFYKRVGTQHADDIVLTFAAVFCCIAFWLQPAIIIPGLLSAEFNLLPVIVFFVFLNRAIWQQARGVTAVLLYISACLCIAVLALDAIYTGKLADALIIGVISLLLLAASFLKKSKRWFVLSALTIVVLGIYMSRSFWLNLAWWIYLLATGLALIGLAAANEAAKQKGSSLSRKASSVFEEWKL
ncbi:MAG: hypothetical protein WCG21_09220 [Eubacteriales bacterium]